LFADAAKERAVFSARTTSATYLQGLRDRLLRLMEGGFDNDLPQLRLELKTMLRDLGYNSETGFPGDADLEIPPAAAGSLRDLASDARLNLILKTQESLTRGAAQKARAMGRTRQFPAFELVRIGTRRIPRGEMGTMGWGRRWIVAGGPMPVMDSLTGTTRLIARKDHPVWSALGSKALFEDALDVDHSPFAYNSGMGLREVALRDWVALVESGQVEDGTVGRDAGGRPTDSLPKVEIPAGLDRDTLTRLRAIATPAYRAQVERRLAAA
jgi:hypothetical protein